MDSKSLSLKIFWLAEVIFSARVLFFSLPVMISQVSLKDKPIISSDDRFIFFVTIAALIYFFIGLASLLGHKLWRLFHYLGVAVVVALTVGFLKELDGTKADIQPVYFLPALMAFISFLYIFFSEGVI